MISAAETDPAKITDRPVVHDPEIVTELLDENQLFTGVVITGVEGMTVSLVQAIAAGVDTFPASSRCVTLKLKTPSVVELYV